MSKHILIVDDEQHFRFAAAVLLRSAGYKVTEAADGHRALKMLLDNGQAEKIDLLIVDVQVPRMSGIELICELKRNGVFIPTLVISGFFNKALLTGLAESGCNEFLGKPFEPREMLDRISIILDKSTGE